MKFYIPKSWIQKKAPSEEGMCIEAGPLENRPERALRLSINPTYDHRDTGDRFTVSSSIGGVTICDEKPIRDPFVSHTIRIHWRDALKCLFWNREIKVCVRVSGDSEICEDVMELDGDYIGHGSTRRAEWNSSIEKSLSEEGEDK